MRVVTQITDQTKVPQHSQEAFGIRELAAELRVSTRTLRHYEDLNLIAPLRQEQNRIYSRRDRARVILILRAKNVGFTLKAIAKFLDLYDADPQHAVQARHVLDNVEAAICVLEAKRADIDKSLQDLRDVHDNCRRFLDSLKEAQ